MPNTRNASANWAQQIGGVLSPQIPDAVGNLPAGPVNPQQQYASSYPGAQPSVLDALFASPGGRMAVQSADAVGNAAQYVPALSGAAKWATDALGNASQAALARSRNTPGYAAAYAQASQSLAQQNANILDEVVPNIEIPLTEMVVGLTQGPNAGNAYADAMTDKINAYTNANPTTSAIAALGGDFLSGHVPGAADALGTIGKSMEALPAVSSTLNASPVLSKAVSDAENVGSKINQAVDATGKLNDVGNIWDDIWQSLTDPASGIAGPASAAAPQTLAPVSSDSYGDFPGAQVGPLDSSGMESAGGFSQSVSPYGVFGNPAFRPESFGADPSNPDLSAGMPPELRAFFPSTIDPTTGAPVE